jgi:hypothetical protein
MVFRRERLCFLGTLFFLLPTPAEQLGFSLGWRGRFHHRFLFGNPRRLDVGNDHLRCRHHGDAMG